MNPTNLKIAWRNLFRNRSFSLINIAGLAIGMGCTLLIFLWVNAERSWDRFHQNYGTVYHALSNRDFNGEITTGPDLMYPLPAAAKAAFPEIEHAALVSFPDNTLFSVGEKRLNKNTLTVSREFFDIFTFETVQGNSAAAVADPDAVILTESTARALFGNTSVINQAVEVNNHRTAYVKAVVRDVPHNSTLAFDALLPINPSTPEVKKNENEWINCNNRVFFKTAPGASIASLEGKLLNLIKERAPHANPTTNGSIVLHPMANWRLQNDFTNGQNSGGRNDYVNLFTWIAFIILAIACVNFMNLSTARSEKRAKEVGIRKTLGSPRGQLLKQFLAESILLSFIAFLLACCLVYAALPAFGMLLNEDISIPYTDPVTWAIAAAMILFTGIIAGSYPAFYLSGFNPVAVLKGSFLPGRQGLLPRKILVTSQFVASIILISATLVIYRQLQHVKDRDLGYQQDRLLMVNSSEASDRNFAAFKNDLLQSGLVAAVNRTSSPVTNIFGFTSGIRWKGAPDNQAFVSGFLFANEDFVQTLDARLLQGRDFRAFDTNTVLLNREAVSQMGLANPLGAVINWAGKDRTVIGVIDNIVMTSPFGSPEPLMVSYNADWSGRVNIRLAGSADTRRAVATIGSLFKKYSAEYPFEYRFVDEEFSQKFVSERLIGRLSITFAGLAIFICCLGLFGLVASAIERRRKEIGIRKVLGATVQSLLVLLSREFLLLVGVAFLIAIPAAWWGMNSWLQHYTYRINIGFGIFIVVGLLILVIALLTVSLNASRAALSSPVKTLRNE
jgi:putative ABC transport system permease protein